MTNEELYLTKDLKNYYNTDFEKLISYRESDFWDLDENIKETLVEINSNSNIHTLYSKRFDFNNDSFAATRISYLKLAFTAEIEWSLSLVLNDILLLYNAREDVEINIILYPPKPNANFKADNVRPIGCLNNRNYFFLNHFHVQITSDIKLDHELFWEFLRKNLRSLK